MIRFIHGKCLKTYGNSLSQRNENFTFNIIRVDSMSQNMHGTETFKITK